MYIDELIDLALSLNHDCAEAIEGHFKLENYLNLSLKTKQTKIENFFKVN